MDPATLILSYGDTSPSSMEIAESILSELKQPKVLESATQGNSIVNHMKCTIHTKYYTNSIFLIPFDGPVEEVPPEVAKAAEALIIYFNTKDKSFIECVPKINKFYKDNDIKLGLLITSSFSGGLNEIAYENLKEQTNFTFDIISLEEDAGESSESPQSLRYEEVVEGLTNVVWSNVKFKPSSNSYQTNYNNPEDLEAQLSDFENLLFSAQHLRSNTQLSRDEFLSKAEELAEVMSKILNDNDSDSD